MKTLFITIVVALFIAPVCFAIVDSNGNGLSDLWEKKHNNGELFLESFDLLDDPDSDGWNNAAEAAAGTNPFDPIPPDGFIRPEITHFPAVIEEDEWGPYIAAPEAISVTWPTAEGKQYKLRFSFDLTAGSWLPVDNGFIGNGNEVSYSFPVSDDVQRFWQVMVGDADTDGDGLTDVEELEIGSSRYLADTDDDGIDDAVAYAAGFDPSGDGSDANSDGIPDDELYSVVFEVQEESHSMSSGVAFEAFGDPDNIHRYLTSKETEKYSVSDSANYFDVTDGDHLQISTYLVNNSILEDGQPVSSETGTTFYDWKLGHGKTLGSGESLLESPSVTTVVGPTITAIQTKTITTKSTSWTIRKNGNVVRSGTEIITTTAQTDLSDEVTYQQLWNNYVKPLPWNDESSFLCGPLQWVDYNRATAGDAVAAGYIRDHFQNNDFGIFGNVSNPGVAYSDSGADLRLKSLRWRWIKFNPQSPFGYEYATPPAAVRNTFHLLISQRDFLDTRAYNSNGPLVDETTTKGIVEIECVASEGSTGWQTVPLTKFDAYKLEDPTVLANLDFSKWGYSQVWIGNNPSGFIVGAGDERHQVASIMEHSGPPSVVLDAITTGDVSISGGEATITIAGDVYDAIMSTVPTGAGADIEKVTILLNGAETEFESSLTRTTDHKSFWTPEGPKASIQPFSVTMPASGVNRITVETTPNAAGVKGRAEFDIVFEKTFDVAVTHAAQTVAYDLLLPSSFSVGSKETIKLVSPGQSTGDDLVETENDSRLFRSALSGAVLLVGKDFQPSAVEGGLPCMIAIPGIPTDNEALGKEIVCQETGPASLRFAYSRDIVSKSESSVYHWTLASVDMAKPGFIGMAQPISFQIADLGEDASLEWFDTEFPITLGEDDYRYYASTAEGKPLMGFLIRSEDEEGAPLREFIYYDHSTGSIQRKEVSSSSLVTTYKLKSSETVLGEFELPLVGWRLLDLEGAESEGLLPVSIESLIDLAEGDTSIEIPEESQAIIEVTGRAPGEVLRVFSPEETADRFDLVVSGDAPLTPPATRSATLTAAGQTQEKLVIYSSGGEDEPATLTDSQWQILKAMGFLAVHNAAPVIASTKDLEWAMKNFGPPHPPGDLPMGVSGVTNPKKAQFYRFKGYQDHHVFNQWSDDLDNPKRKRWIKIFGNDFDVDEFTVPVKQEYHSKISHQISDEWDDFLSESFDENHQLRPGIDGQKLRRDTLDKMREINGRWGIDTSRLRPYPRILKRPSLNPTLCNRLIENSGRLGSSLDKLKVIDEMAFGPILKGANAARNGWWKTTIKKVFKREGKKGVGKLIPVISAAMTVYSVSAATIDVTQYGWEEAAAQAINEQLSLDDIELAREAVRQQFSTGLIGGGTPRPVLPLANGQVIGMNERTYRCYWGPNGKIHTIVPYVISEIKVFPDGSSKVAAVMEVPPFESMIEADPEFIIRDYWPMIGDASELYLDANARAMANQGGNP